MSELLHIYREILVLSRQKKDILVAGKPADLAEVVKKEEILIIRAGKIDVVRQQVIQLIVKESHHDSTITMSDLLLLAPERAAVELRSISYEFQHVLAELKERNILNTQLLQQALKLINFNINLLTQNAVGPTYSPYGSHGQPVQGRTMFDQKG